jgi:hypothetical protein
VKTTTVETYVKREHPAGGAWFKRCEVRILSTDDGEEIGMIAEHIDRNEQRHLEALTDLEKRRVRLLANAAPKAD